MQSQMFLDAGAFNEGLLFLQLGQAILTETEKTKLEFIVPVFPCR